MGKIEKWIKKIKPLTEYSPSGYNAMQNKLIKECVYSDRWFCDGRINKSSPKPEVFAQKKCRYYIDGECTLPAVCEVTKRKNRKDALI